MRVPPLLRLCRPALAPTAAADVIAGAAFAGGAATGPLLFATGASLCIYMAGMAQNDLCDRARDKTLHPDRPLPADPALAGPARVLVALLYAAGLGLAALAGVLWPAAAAALLANAYNLGLKRWFPFDAFTLGGARAANLTIGAWVAAGALAPAPLLYAGFYGLYIAAVTGASRTEDVEPRERRRNLLWLAFAGQSLAVAGLASLSTRLLAALLVLAPWVVLLWAAWSATNEATRGAAKKHVLVSLLMIPVVHMAVVGPAFALIVCFFAGALLLRALSPPRRGP